MNAVAFHYLHSSPPAQLQVLQVSPSNNKVREANIEPKEAARTKRKETFQIEHTSNSSRLTLSLLGNLEDSKPAFSICSLKNLIFRAISMHLFIWMNERIE